MKTIDDLKKEILLAHWIDMRFHLERGNLFLISNTLDLSKIGFALASDHVSEVETWIKNGAIVRLEDTNQFDKEEPFAILIVQPFILAQKINNIGTH